MLPCRLIHLPPEIRDANELLQMTKGHGKASALKTKKSTRSDVVIGPLREIEASHADGQPVKLMVQVN